MRIRLLFSKTGALRFTGHLDLQTLLERTARRAGLPLAYTQGFHPGPRIQIACALPLGVAGLAEIVDMWLDADPGNPHEIIHRLQAGSPPGLTILSLETVEDHAPALQTRVVSAEYTVTLLETGESALPARVEALLAAASLPRQRRGKPYDLRPLVEELLTASGPSPEAVGGEGLQLLMRLATRPGATGRPEEVLDALGIPPEAVRIERTRLILKSGIE